MNFAVVEFLDDASVDVVPCKWLSGDICFWPPYRASRLQTAKKKSEEPCETWTQNKARILGLYDSYTDARARLARATETSTLETDDDDDGEAAARSRVKRRKTFSDLEDDEDDAQPRARQKQTDSRKKAAISGDVPVPTGLLDTGHDDVHPTVNPTANIPRTSPRKPTRAADELRPSAVTPTTSSAPSPPVCSNNMTSGKARPSSESRLVLLKLTRLEQQQQHQMQMLQKILNVLQAADNESSDVPEGVDLPVKTVAAMKELERKLADEELYRKLVRYLGCLGGKDVAETTRRVLRTLLDNSVAIRMNFAGRGGKHGIENMQLLRLVVAAVRRNKLIAKATRSEIENVVKLWLRYAADRSGGRRGRPAASRQAASRNESDVSE